MSRYITLSFQTVVKDGQNWCVGTDSGGYILASPVDVEKLILELHKAIHSLEGIKKLMYQTQVGKMA